MEKCAKSSNWSKVNIAKCLFLCLLPTIFQALSGRPQKQSAGSSLPYIFQNPPQEAKPWIFWYWMYGAMSKDGLTKDLEAMKKAGLGGAYLMPIKSPQQFSEFKNGIEQLSPAWWKMVNHSLEEADRLGLKIGMHICDGFALAGGPWIRPEESMQKVVFSDTIVEGSNIKDLKIRQPETNENYYQDIALLAYPVDEFSQMRRKPKISVSSEVDTTGGFFRVSSADILNPTSDGAWIQYDYGQSYTCRSIEIVKVNNNYQAQRMKVMASDDGIHFRVVKQMVPARQGWQNYDFNATHAISPTTARYFRFYWNPAGSEPGGEELNDAKWKPNLKIKEIILHADPHINQWEGKSGLVWRIAEPTIEGEIANKDCIQKKELVDLTQDFRNGSLSVVLAKGKWKIVRLGHTSTAHTNATGGAGKGLECDKFSRKAVQKQLDNWFGAVFRNTDATLARRTLKYMHVDSWECGSQNWSANFLDEFRKRRGYDLKPYLLLYAGIPVESAEISEKVLRDIRTTIADLVVDVFYDVVAESAQKYDCRLSAECVAPTMVSDGLLHYQKVDLPMGEFWFNSPTHDKFNDMLDAVSGAHIYGKNIIQAEGMTQLRGTWNEHPGMMKTLLDRNYALGINKVFFHVFVHNPYPDRKPGMTLDGIGFFFQRDQTWWKNGAKAIVDYASRCQTLLQYGKPVTDIAVFTGEEIPRRAILPEKMVASLPGIFGKNRVENEKKRLDNIGQPLKTIDGVTFSANMTTPESWINPLNGYAYDSFNQDVFLKAQTKNGQMVLPSGASYKVVVFPLPTAMDPNATGLSTEVKAKIEEMRTGGVIIPTLPYRDADFSNYDLARDVIVPENIAWTHRSGCDAEIYFISNQQQEYTSFDASLRANGEQVQLWHPTTGSIEVAANVRPEFGRTVVPLRLAPGESVFIVIVNNTSLELTQPKPKDEVFVDLPVKHWTVYFPEIDRAVTRSTLFDWSLEADENIKFYSGSANYSASFDCAKTSKTCYFLSFEKVENVASVKVNGIDCGTIWTQPYRIDITKALKPGINELQIEVSNTWANAINAADKGKAPFEGIWTNAKYRMKGDKLLPSGLTGKVKLVYGE
jgi:hypothetical protein